ncbi:MAG: glycosyltransferase [Acidobacteria bacterium]|nr:glycosyltransferase [Acidobacteriota bacterium]
MPLRIGILMDHPSPHMVALLESVAGRKDCTLEVIYCGKNAPGRIWGAPAGDIPHHFVRGITGPLGVRFNPGILQAMSSLHIDVWVINTIYGSPTTLMAAQWLHFRGKPWIYMNEPVRPRTGIRAAIKELLLQHVLNKADGITGTGKAAVDLYRKRLKKDIPSQSIPYFIDISEFLDLPDPIPPAENEDLCFVTSGQLIERKGFGCLLEACRHLPEKGWHLKLIGDGPLRSALERKLEQYGLANRVRMDGAIPYSQRARCYAGSHVFLFPSLWDGWGMVVPEALASGLPVVSSDQVMSAHEFINNGKNGFITPAGDPDALAGKMLWFLGNTSSYRHMSTEARKSVADYTSDLGAEALVHFLQKLSTGAIQRQLSRCDFQKTDKPTWNKLTTPGKFSERTKLRIRNMAKKAVIQGSVLAHRPQKAKGHSIIAYHLVLEEDRRNFEDHLKFYRDHFRISPLRELLQTAASGDSDGFSLAITFDDGFRLLMHDCLQILEKYGIKASFFIPAAFINSRQRQSADEFSARSFYYRYSLEPMQPADLRQLSALGHEVGSHGLFHTNIHSLTPESAERELAVSRSMISDWTGIEPEGYAYPYGVTANACGNPADWLQKAGFAYGLSLTRGTVDSSSNYFVLPRHHAEGNWPVRDLRYFLFA